MGFVLIPPRTTGSYHIALGYQSMEHYVAKQQDTARCSYCGTIWLKDARSCDKCGAPNRQNDAPQENVERPIPPEVYWNEPIPPENIKYRG